MMFRGVGGGGGGGRGGIGGDEPWVEVMTVYSGLLMSLIEVLGNHAGILLCPALSLSVLTLV